MLLFDIGEKRKFILVSFVIFIIGYFSMSTATQVFLSRINKAYINQNIAIIGEISKIENVDIDNVIEVITKGNISAVSKGENILTQYGYNEKLPYTLNNIFSNEIKNANKLIVLIFSLIFVLMFTYMFTKLSVLYRGMNKLKEKAEMIVEGRVVKLDNKEFKDDIIQNLDIQFNIMKQRVDNSIEVLQDEKINLKNIISDISHQLKTPLASMAVYNEILMDHRNMDVDELDKFNLATKGQLSRIDFLVKTLLKYARLESNVVRYNKEVQSINNTIKECVDTLSAKARSKNVEINIIEKNEILLNHDRAWLEEAFINIIKNGIEHSRENSRIDISIIESDIFTRIEIRDYGKGISEYDISKIFNRFHKGSNNVNPESIGIGLSLSKKIIEGNNGSITVRSKVNEGSNFIITFLT